MRMPDIHPNKVPGAGVEPENARSPSSGSALLPKINHETFVYELLDKLGYCRYTGIEILAEFGDAVFSLLDAKTEYVFFQD